MTDMFDAMTPDMPEAPFSYTMKDARGDLFTVRGADWESFHENVTHVIGNELFDKVTGEIRDRVGSQGYSAGQAQPAAQAAAPASQPAADGPAPSGQGDWKAKAPYCPHGQRRPQEWTAKSGPQKGKTQYTYFCPLPREAPADQKCTPIDAISGKEWGS